MCITLRLDIISYDVGNAEMPHVNLILLKGETSPSSRDL